jgi:hypothetical protein
MVHDTRKTVYEKTTNLEIIVRMSLFLALYFLFFTLKI